MSNTRISSISSRMLRANHYFFFLQPYQVNRLRHLRQTVNSLFEKSPAITIVDLLYAVLWKRISALQTDKSSAVLMLIEQEEQSNNAAEPGHNNLIKSIFMCEKELLSQQSPVSIAQHIRTHIDSKNSSASYEGWLVDSLPPSSSNSADVYYSDALICTILSLPLLQRLEARFRQFNNISTHGTRRVCSINSVPQQDGALSVDMQLPAEEIERFKFRYGDGHSVPPAFYEN